MQRWCSVVAVAIYIGAFTGCGSGGKQSSTTTTTTTTSSPSTTIDPAAPPDAALATWPPGAVAGGTYVVPASQATMDIRYLRLPDGFRITFAPDVTQVHWIVGTLDFGQNATIDLGPVDKNGASSGARGSDIGGQATFGQQGAQGGQGGAGAPGVAGRNLVLEVDNVLPHGSLLITTDGGHGGIGGIGGRGQTGGGSRCNPDQDAGPGGNGGRGGTGGDGGATSTVDLFIKSFANGYRLEPAGCGFCGQFVPPPPMGGDDGKIVVWGTPGCGGMGGLGGEPGAGDNSVPLRLCRHFPGNNRFVRGSGPGQKGGVGPFGKYGACGHVVIRGPAP